MFDHFFLDNKNVINYLSKEDLPKLKSIINLKASFKKINDQIENKLHCIRSL